MQKKPAEYGSDLPTKPAKRIPIGGQHPNGLLRQQMGPSSIYHPVIWRHG